jgi:hypothetical protein
MSLKLSSWRTVSIRVSLVNKVSLNLAFGLIEFSGSHFLLAIEHIL